MLAACAVIEDWWGDIEVPMGRNHGDWIPPNISIRTDGAFNVWDWERSGRDVPLGIDTMQFILFVESLRRKPGRTLAGRVNTYGQAALSRHGLDPRTSGLLSVLSLLGSILWYGEARAAGREQEEDSRFIGTLELLIDPCQGANSLRANPALPSRHSPPTIS